MENIVSLYMFNNEFLETVAMQLVADGKGVLAADESLGTIGKRFDMIGIENNHANRLAYRKLLFATQGLGQFVSGVITFDETIREQDASGRFLVQDLLDAGMLVGIKVDQGVEPLAEDSKETVMKSVPDLAESLKEYKQIGASFSKFRAVVRIDKSQGQPSVEAYKKNAQRLAEIALVCQQNEIVPIVEPEVLMDGEHGLKTSLEVTRQFLLYTFDALADAGVYLPGMLIKTNFVRCGATNAQSECSNPNDIAKATLEVLYEVFPREIPGVLFLSGGMSESQATSALNAINIQDLRKNTKLSFSYGRALQASCLKAWQGADANINAAQKALFYRAQLNYLACLGKYAPVMEENLSASDDLFESNYTY